MSNPILKSLFKRPLPLVPVQDLGNILDSSMELEVDLEVEFQSIYGDVKNLKRAAMNRDTTQSLTNFLQEYTDEELEGIEFPNIQSSSENLVGGEQKPLDLAGNERFLLNQESVKYKEVIHEQDTENDIPENVIDNTNRGEKRPIVQSMRSTKKLKISTEETVKQVSQLLDTIDSNREIVLKRIANLLVDLNKNNLKIDSADMVRTIQWEALKHLDGVHINGEELVLEIHSCTMAYFQCLKVSDFKVLSDEGLTTFISGIKSVIDWRFSNLELAIANFPYFLPMIEEIVNAIELPDSMVNTISLSCLNWINTDGDKDISKLSDILFCTTRVLKALYAKYPGERNYIIKSILETLQSMTDMKIEHKIIPISGHVKISVVTYCLLSLFQYIDTGVLVDEHRKYVTANMYRESFTVAHGFELMYHLNADQYHRVILSLCNTAKAGNKFPLEAFTTDLLATCDLTSYPSLPQIIQTLVAVLNQFLKDDSLPQAIETFLIGLSGDICRTIVKSPSYILDASASDDAIMHYQLVLQKQLSFLTVSEKKEYNFAFSLLIIKNIVRVLEVQAVLARSQFMTYTRDQKINPGLLNFYSFLLKTLANPQELIKPTELVQPQESALVSEYEHEKNTLFNLFVKFLSNPRIKSRAKAVSVLSKLLSYTDLVGISSAIQFLLPKMLTDGSAMVRDSVIEFFYTYLTRNRNKSDLFYDALSDCLSDESSQVRKSSFKLTKEIFDDLTTDSAKGQVLSKILSRIGDEDEILRDSASAFMEEYLNRDPKGIVSCLVMMLKSSARTSSDFQFFLEQSDPNLLIKTLLEYLIKDALIDESKNTSDVLWLVSVIVKCNGRLFPYLHLTTLQPYLLDAEVEKDTFYFTLVILKYALPHLPVLNNAFAIRLVSNLTPRLSKLAVRELHEAVQLLSILATYQNDNIKLTNATISSLKHLRQYVEIAQRNVDPGQDPKLCKLLDLIGCFGSYCSLNNQREAFLKANLGLKANETTTSLITKFLLTFTDQTFNFTLRSTAIRNILSICLTHPQLYESQIVLSLIDKGLDDEDGSTRIKHIIVQNLHEFVKQVDKESKDKLGTEIKTSTDININLAAFTGNGESYYHDAVCAGLIQKFNGKILRLCFHRDYTFALVPVLFTKLVFGLGYDNPKFCIATFIGLQASRDKSIRRTSLAILQTLFEKHESLFESSYGEAIKLATKYYQDSPKEFFRIRHFFSRLYNLVSKSVGPRKKFINGILKTLKASLISASPEARVLNRDMTIFTMTNLSKVSFLTVEEVYLVANTINDILTHEGMDLYETVKEVNPTLKSVRDKLSYGAEMMVGLLEFNAFLMNKYSIDPERITHFNKERVDLELRKAPKIHRDVEFNFSCSETMLCQERDTEAILGKYVVAMHLYNTN